MVGSVVCWGTAGVDTSFAHQQQRGEHTRDASTCLKLLRQEREREREARGAEGGGREIYKPRRVVLGRTRAWAAREEIRARVFLWEKRNERKKKKMRTGERITRPPLPRSPCQRRRRRYAPRSSWLAASRDGRPLQPRPSTSVTRSSSFRFLGYKKVTFIFSFFLSFFQATHDASRARALCCH